MFRLYLENQGTTNPIVGVYIVPQGTSGTTWGPNLLDIDPATNLPVPLEPGQAIWLSQEFATGPIYDWPLKAAYTPAYPLPKYRPLPRWNPVRVVSPIMA
jgi:hypothetical protein